MKIGCSSWSYHREISKGMSQVQWIKRCVELGFDGVELLDIHFPKTDTNYLKKIKKLLIKHCLTISCVSVTNDFAKDSVNEQADEVKKVKRWIDIASFFGAPIIRVFTGWPREESARKRLWPKMIDCMKECVKYAAEKGIVSGLENHNHDGFTRTGEDVLKILKEVDHEWMGLVLDTGGYVDSYKSIKETVHLATHVHAKFYNLDEKGEEQNYDFKKVFRMLKDVRFNGYLSIEYEGEEEEHTAVPRAVSFLRRLVRGTR